MTQKESMAERKTCVSIYSREDPDSVWSRLPNRGREAIDNVPAYLKTWSYRKLEKTFADKFSVRDKILKVSFWREYQDALDNDRTMSMRGMCHGICPHVYLYDHVFVRGQLMAWILYPMPSYEAAMNEMLDLSTRRLRDILAAKPFDAKGKLDTNLARLQIKVHQLVENRVRGVNPHVLNINQRSVNVNHNTVQQLPKPGETADGKRMTLAELEREISQVKSRIKSLPSNKGYVAKPQRKHRELSESIIDVTPESVAAKVPDE